MLRANAKWVDNYIIDVDNARGHFVKMDLPPSYKGDDTAATPLEYIVMSFAGCTVLMFKIVANKMRLNIDSIDISVEAKKPEDIQTVTEIKSVLTVRSLKEKN
jgi:putative redox protein